MAAVLGHILLTRRPVTGPRRCPTRPSLRIGRGIDARQPDKTDTTGVPVDHPHAHRPTARARISAGQDLIDIGLSQLPLFHVLWGTGIMDMVTKVMDRMKSGQIETEKIETDSVGLEASIYAGTTHTGEQKKAFREPEQQHRPQPGPISTPAPTTTPALTQTATPAPTRRWETIPP